MPEPTVQVLIKRLDPDLPLPRYARADDAGLDLHSARTITLAPGERAMVPTGLALAIPPGYAGFVVPRSGLALRHGLSQVNTPGVVDAGYRGEVMVLLINHDRATPVTLERGDRIAQLVIQRVERAELVEAAELPPSDRGAGGFGSTGTATGGAAPPVVSPPG